MFGVSKDNGNKYVAPLLEPRVIKHTDARVSQRIDVLTRVNTDLNSPATTKLIHPQMGSLQIKGKFKNSCSQTLWMLELQLRDYRVNDFCRKMYSEF